MSKRKLFLIAAMSLAAVQYAAAAVIGDGLIVSSLDGANAGRTSNGQDAYTLSYIDSRGTLISADYAAAITTDGISLFLQNRLNSTFAGLTGGVVDIYTVTGPNVGTTRNLTVTLTVAGTSTAGIPRDTRSGGAIGRDLTATGQMLGGNPVIVNPAGKVDPGPMTIVGVHENLTRAFSYDVVANLEIQVGTPFQLAFSTTSRHGYDAVTDSTASISFDLPSDLSISSQKGFGATQVPVPASAGLLCAGLAVIRRLRGKARNTERTAVAGNQIWNGLIRDGGGNHVV